MAIGGGSFVHAADALGMSKPAVSRYMADLVEEGYDMAVRTHSGDTCVAAARNNNGVILQQGNQVITQ